MNIFKKAIKSNCYAFNICNVDAVNKIFVTNILRKCNTSINTSIKNKFVYLKKKKKSSIENGSYILLIIPVTAFALGTWQIQRKIWKEELIKKLENSTKLEPVDFPNDLNELQNMEYHLVKVKGSFDHDREFLMGPKTLIKDKTSESSLLSSPLAGYWVITPFKLSDRDLTIMVNRGWVPAKQKLPKFREEGQINGEVELTGVVRHSEKRQPLGMKNIPEKGLWMYRDLEKMAEYCDAFPILIDANASSTVPGGPIGGQTVVNLHNFHLTYIITWYSLCAVTSFLWYKRYVKVPV